jgi:hypothetical protein
VDVERQLAPGVKTMLDQVKRGGVTCATCKRPRAEQVVRTNDSGTRALCRGCATNDRTDRQVARQREQFAQMRRNK